MEISCSTPGAACLVTDSFWSKRKLISTKNVEFFAVLITLSAPFMTNSSKPSTSILIVIVLSLKCKKSSPFFTDTLSPFLLSLLI